MDPFCGKGNHTRIGHGGDMTNQCVILFGVINATLIRVVFEGQISFLGRLTQFRNGSALK